MDTKNLGEFIKRGTAIGNKFGDLVNEVRGLGQLVFDTLLDTPAVDNTYDAYNTEAQLMALSPGTRIRPDGNPATNYHYVKSNQPDVWTEVLFNSTAATGNFYNSRRLLNLAGQYVPMR